MRKRKELLSYKVRNRARSDSLALESEGIDGAPRASSDSEGIPTLYVQRELLLELEVSLENDNSLEDSFARG